MKNREERGRAIAETMRIVRKGLEWIVPSQSSNRKYSVRLDTGKQSCTCKDHEDFGGRCKHIIAAELIANGHELDGEDQHEARVSELLSRKRMTYTQDWPAYNRAQTTEKAEFLRLLSDLCTDIPQPSQKTGRPMFSRSDAIFSAAFKVYSTFSGRRFMTDLSSARDAGLISRAPCYNMIFKILESEEATPILKNLIVKSSLPLKSVEVDFAVDSSGFTSCRFHRWFDHKYNKTRQEHEWCKVHVMCGTKTNVVTAAEILHRDAQDCPLLPELLKTTAESFTVREVSGDKAFGSFKNYDAIEAVGATPFIPFKSHQGYGQKGRRKHELWARMYHYFMFRRDEFLSHYHKRSNIESTFSMIKAKFGDYVRSRTEIAMRNEALCKILCHNICCLISAMHELGIEPQLI
jgi:transposase